MFCAPFPVVLLFMHIEIPPNLFFSRLISPSFLSLCSFVRCFNHFLIFAALSLFWLGPAMPFSPSSLGADNWVQHSRCVSALPRQARPTPPDLLAVLFRMQSRILLGIFSSTQILEFLIKMKTNGKITISLCCFYSLDISVFIVSVLYHLCMSLCNHKEQCNKN